MRHGRFVVVVGLALLAWSAQDAILWRVYFDGRPWSAAAAQYQYWHQAFLVLLVVLGIRWLGSRYALPFTFAVWTLASSGLADVLYYWLALRPLPARLPWLDDAVHPFVLIHPATSTTILISSLLWVNAWLLVSLIAPHRSQVQVPA